MMTETPVREMMQDEIDRLTREVERLTNERDTLALAMWDARGILGFDNDGDREPWATIAGSGYFGFAAQHVTEAKQQRDDYEEVMDLWDGTERKDWTARAEKAEKDAAIYKDAFKDATIANTVAARKLAEQEAKTVEYRAAWIKATRERDEYRKLLREERDGRRILELEAGWVEADR